MEPSKKAVDALKPSVGILEELLYAYAIDFAALRANLDEALAEHDVSDQLLADSKNENAALRSELQASNQRILELEAGEQEPWDMPDASPTYAELEQQLQAFNKRILELERNAAAAANMYSSCLEQLESVRK